MLFRLWPWLWIVLVWNWEKVMNHSTTLINTCIISLLCFVYGWKREGNNSAMWMPKPGLRHAQKRWVLSLWTKIQVWTNNWKISHITMSSLSTGPVSFTSYLIHTENWKILEDSHHINTFLLSKRGMLFLVLETVLYPNSPS